MSQQRSTDTIRTKNPGAEKIESVSCIDVYRYNLENNEALLLFVMCLFARLFAMCLCGEICLSFANCTRPQWSQSISDQRQGRMDWANSLLSYITCKNNISRRKHIMCLLLLFAIRWP